MAIVDPALTRSLPPLVAAASGMDALSQAIESYWCVNSTDESKDFAREAIGRIVPHIREAVHAASDEPRLAVAQGAHLSGKAINITRTTAPHALSYALTSRFGVPHGQAVSLTFRTCSSLIRESRRRIRQTPGALSMLSGSLEIYVPFSDAAP